MKDKKKTISACLILKNEGATIYRCLDSIKDFVDEYIIGIDGSTDDNTKKEIIKFFNNNNIDTIENPSDKYTALKRKENRIGCIYPFKWQEDFSKARNEGMDKATGDYILIMDGHEYIPKDWFCIDAGRVIPIQSGLAEVKEMLQEDLDEVYFQLYQQPFNGMIPANYFLQPRIYRNDKKLRFNRPAHNTIKGSRPDKVKHLIDMIIVHDAEEENRKVRKEQRLGMNIPKIEEQIKKNPKDSRNYFYLGNTYLEAKEYKKSIKAFKQYLKARKDETSERYQVYIHMALCYQALNDYKNMRDTLYLAKAIDPLRKDAYSLLGDLYMANKNYENAIYEITNLLKLKPSPSRMFQNGAANTFDPHQKLAACYELIGDIPKAAAHLKQALTYVHNPAWVEKLKSYYANKINLLIIDRGGSFTGGLFKYMSEKKDKYNVVFSPNYDVRLCMWADTIWAEWGNDDAYLCSKNFPKKTIIRTHGWEAYGLRHLWNQIDWNGIKKNVFVCNHIKERMEKLAKIKPEQNVIIHNGVDTEKFYIKNWKREMNNVGFAGYMNTKKNPFLLLQIIKENPNINFHLRMEHQDEFWKATFDYELKDCKNVVYHARYDDLSDFWNQMNGVLSTSIIESFSYNIAEAMACGCIPFVYNWKGAEEFWHDYIFTEKPDFKKLDKVTDKDRKFYRKYILERFDEKKKLEEMEKLIVENTDRWAKEKEA
jgi:tetratricopeptide (TPR) repeat protein